MLDKERHLGAWEAAGASPLPAQPGRRQLSWMSQVLGRQGKFRTLNIKNIFRDIWYLSPTGTWETPIHYLLKEAMADGAVSLPSRYTGQGSGERWKQAAERGGRWSRRAPPWRRRRACSLGMNTHQRGRQRKRLAKEAETEVGEEGNQRDYHRSWEWGVTKRPEWGAASWRLRGVAGEGSHRRWGRRGVGWPRLPVGRGRLAMKGCGGGREQRRTSHRPRPLIDQDKPCLLRTHIH